MNELETLAKDYQAAINWVNELREQAMTLASNSCEHCGTGYSQRAVASAINVSQAALSRWMNGTRNYKL